MARATERRPYKKGVDMETGRRRREVTMVNLRKVKKEEHLFKKRASVTSFDGNETAGATSVGGLLQRSDSSRKLPTLAEIPQLLQTATSASSFDDRLNAVRDIRRMLSVQINPPVKQLIQAGVLPILIRFLAFDDQPTLQFEATWALTNITSTDLTAEVVNAGATPGLVRLLQSPKEDIRDQAAWCVGNIAGDSTELRDFVLKQGALHALLLNVSNPANKTLLRNVVWTISNLCRAKPSPEFSLVKDCIPAMPFVIAHPLATEESQADAFYALSYIADGGNTGIQAVVEAGVIPYAITALGTGKSKIIFPAMRVLGNIVTGNEVQTQAVLDAGILDHILPMLQHNRKLIRKEAAWMVSNIAAGTESQITEIFQKPNIVIAVVEMSRSATWEIRREAVWAVANLFIGASAKQISTLVELDAIESMADILDLVDVGMVLVALDAIKHVLRVGKARGRRYDIYFEECGGIVKLEKLQHHTNDKVYSEVVAIIDEFYGCDEETDEDENLAPSQNQDGLFAFGLPSPSPSKNLFGSMSDTAQSPTVKFDFSSSFGGMNSSNMNM